MFRQLVEFLTAQPMFTGMVGAMLTGGVLYSLRQIPGRALAALRELFSVTLIVDSQDEVYDHLNLWLGRSPKARRARRLMLENSYDYEAGRWGWGFTLGEGWHLLLYRRRLLIIHRHVPPAEALDRIMGNGRRQRLTVTSIGRAQDPIRALVSEAQELYRGDGRVQVYFYNQGGWMMADRRLARPLDTVYLPAAQKQRLVQRLIRFLAARDEYRRRGIPWRLGVLLEGPPGTGKTTLIFVLAGLLGRACYVLNLNTVGSDNELVAAFNAVGPDAVVALEDIDTATIAHDRNLTCAAPAAVAATLAAGAPATSAPGEQKGVTLSGLLNAIDGIAAREGRILFMTSNHAEKLDPALVRPGRVDVRETVDRLGREAAWSMFRAFRPSGPTIEFEQLVAGRLPISAAALQDLLMSTDPSAANDDHAFAPAVLVN